MRPWLVVGALAVCGCEEDQRDPSYQFSRGGSSMRPEPPDLRTANWTWSECGVLPGSKSAAVSAQFALAGEALLVTYEDGSLLLHRVGQVASALLRRTGETVQPRVSPDGQFAVDWEGGTLVMHDLTDFRSSRELALEAGGCGTAFSLSADNSQLLFTGSPASCVFDVETGMGVARVETNSEQVAFVGDHFVVAQADFTFASYDDQGLLLATTSLDVPTGSLLLELTSDGLAVVERPDHGYVVYEAETGTLLAELEAAAEPTEPIFSPDGALMLVDDRVVALADGELVLTADPGVRRGEVVALSFDGARAAVLDGFEIEQRAAVVEVETGAGVQAFGGHGRPVLGLAVSPDGTAMVSTSGDQTFGYVLAEDFSDTRARWMADAQLWLAASYSPDGTLIALSGDSRALLDAETGARVFSPPPPPGVRTGCFNSYFHFSHDQRWVAGGGYDFGFDVFDADEQTLVTTLPSSTCNAAVAFSADDSLLATSGPELYRTSDWSRLWPEDVVQEPNLAAFLTRVHFHPDGRGIEVSTCGLEASSGAFSCATRMFEVETGAEVAKSTADMFGGYRAFSPDGSWMLSGNVLLHRYSTEQRSLSRVFTASAFAPDGDIIGGDREGNLVRFCKSEGP